MINIPFKKIDDLFLVMTKFETNLWTFLSQMKFLHFNLVQRLDMALNLALEVKKMSGDRKMRTAHRDLKPSNIMLDATGNLSIIDVGIGRTYDIQKDYLSWGSCGTVGFLAPEQFTCRQQSHEVDIWALGKIIALTICEWSFGWQLLWSPKFLKSNEIKSLGPLVKLIDLLKDMMNVGYNYSNTYLPDILLHVKISTSLIKIKFVMKGFA